MIVPVEALHQTRDTTFVYTSYDPETKQYGDMKAVPTGMQTDDYADILSGLEIGDTVYYTEQENIFAAIASMMGMGGNMGGNMGGGQRPGGMKRGG